MSAHLLPGFRWVSGMQALLRFSASGPAKLRLVDDVGIPGWEPDWSDPATGGCCMALLGTEAWRVRYSPSIAKQAAGTPWTAEAPSGGGSPSSRITMHATQGEACRQVALALGRWPGGAP